MEKIVTHPLYIRCQKVIKSCKTVNQKDMARNYKKLCKKRIGREYYKKTKNQIKTARFNFALDYYFDKLWC
jgi:hypothetical protein